MNVLMLGWEYPPHISGGLGTACEGLSRALASRGLGINFVVPHLYGDEPADHMQLSACDGSGKSTESYPIFSSKNNPDLSLTRIPAFLSPYMTEESFDLSYSSYQSKVRTERGEKIFSRAEHYSNDIFQEVELYGRNIFRVAQRSEFQLIHAHDWMTYPAAVALKQHYGLPLILHAHSLEFDRAGDQGNRNIQNIEKLGFEAADKIIAVSKYTGSIIVEQYGISPSKISVVHNGVGESYRKASNCLSQGERNNTVIYLGRVTFQKGPDYFIRCAEKVISKNNKIRFCLAGSGDMMASCKKIADQAGILSRIDFPGFLKGEQVRQALSQSSLYMMPSVSEPFGISALEAASLNTPALISKQSGVSEVLRHTLRSDYWDTDLMAEYVLAAMKHRSLREDLSQMAAKELSGITWSRAAEKTSLEYNNFI